MGIATWWYGPASIDHEPRSEGAPETSVEFGGQTLLQSHYQEIRSDFEAACDEVRLYRSHFEHQFPRDGDTAGVVSDPNDVDEAVLEALTLVGYVGDVNWPVIRFEFGSRRPGALSWDHGRVTGFNSDLHHERRRKALKLQGEALDESGLPPGFEDASNDVSKRVSERLSTAYRAARRRVLEAGQGRAAPWKSWMMLASVGIWFVAAGLLLWLILGSEVPLPALLIAGLALATTARTVQVRVHNNLSERHSRTWQRGPVRLRWTSRAAVREARANSRRDVWVGSVTGVIGAVIGAALAWLAWLAQR